MSRKLTFTISLLGITVLTFFVSCKNDFEQPNRLLSGQVGGMEWLYKYARATYTSIDDKLEVSMYSRQQTEGDPCSVFISTLGHIKFSVPLEKGYYVIPSDLQVRFEQAGSGSEVFLATSGFVEIVEIQGVRVSGIMQAKYDEGNGMEGNFIFDRCN